MKDFFNYDFTGKRVRYQGKCMTKFDLAYHIDSLSSWSCMTVIFEVFSYDELRSKLFDLLN